MASSEARNSENSRVSSFINEEKQYETTIAKLKFELANIKNYSHYLENIQNMQNQKYETLGQIMAHYLENLLYSKRSYDDQL